MLKSKNKQKGVFVLILLVCCFFITSCNIQNEPNLEKDGGEIISAILSSSGDNAIDIEETTESFYKEVEILYKSYQEHKKDMIATLIVPIDWELETIDEKEYYGEELFFSKTIIYKNGEEIGYTGYNTYPTDNNHEDFYHYLTEDYWYLPLFNQLLYSNHYSWGNANDFIWINQSSTSGSTITDVEITILEEGKTMAECEIRHNKGILSYNHNLLKYIGIEIDEDFVSEEELAIIAESIVLTETN